MENIEIEIKTVVRGLFRKKIVFEVKRGNVTDYAYSIADLTTILIRTYQISTTELWTLLNGLESKYYKLK